MGPHWHRNCVCVQLSFGPLDHSWSLAQKRLAAVAWSGKNCGTECLCLSEREQLRRIKEFFVFKETQSASGVKEGCEGQKPGEFDGILRILSNRCSGM